MLRQDGRIVFFGDDLRDFSDTAALLDLMDLVITIDTSVAHLAGAMGKPVWILLPYSADWRWLLDRTDSPWYPSARLFRQREIGNWAALIEEVKRELRDNYCRRHCGEIISSLPSTFSCKPMEQPVQPVR